MMTLEDEASVEAEIVAAEESSAAPAKTVGPKLSEAQWTEIRTAYEMGAHRIPALSAQYGVSGSAISQHFNRHSEKTGKKLIFGRIPNEAQEKAAKEAAAEKHNFASKRQERTELTKEEGWNDSALIRHQWRKLQIDAIKAGVPISSYTAEIKAIRHLEATYRGLLDTRWKLLDMDKNVDATELTRLPIMDYTEDQLKKIRAGGEEVDLSEGDLALPEEDEALPSS